MKKHLTIGVMVCVWLVRGADVVASRDTDALLTERAVQSLQQYGPFGIFDDVNISVQDRVVTLSGQVTQEGKKTDIGKRIASLDGVRQLINELEVLPASMKDEDLRRRVARAIYNHPSFWRYASMAQPPVHIIVEDGRIKLTGRVSSEIDRSLASALARVPGAFEVTNELRASAR
jgi:hyperosmotically inducible periplasmic protein